jgi:hypothetical protein
MGVDLSRREFLIGAGALALSLGHLALRPAGAGVATAEAPTAPSYADWQDIYRQRWAWDSISRAPTT